MLLEIGPGKKKLSDDWVTIGPDAAKAIDIAGEWLKLPFPDETFSLIYASHVLEHIPWFRTIDALREAYRVLKHDGVLEVWVPDFRKIVDAYEGQFCGDSWRKYNPEDDFMMWVNGRIFTYGGAFNEHHAVFDEASLRKLFARVGFRQILPLVKPRGVSHGPINLGIAGRKSFA